MATATLSELRTMTRDLSPEDKLALLEELAQQLRPSFPRPDKPPYRSLRGILSHLGPGPSDEEIAEARREAWKNFPKDFSQGEAAPIEPAANQGQTDE